MNITKRRRSTLALVQGGFVHRDRKNAEWIINGNPAQRWHGRTLSELRTAVLISVAAEVDPETEWSSVTLTEQGQAALS